MVKSSQLQTPLAQKRYSNQAIASRAVTMPARLVERRRWSRKRSSNSLPRIGILISILQSENLIYRAAENLRERQREEQAGNVAVALDGIDALTRDAYGGGELLLGPATVGAKFFDAIVDDGAHVKRAFHGRIGHLTVDVKHTLHILRH